MVRFSDFHFNGKENNNISQLLNALFLKMSNDIFIGAC